MRPSLTLLPALGLMLAPASAAFAQGMAEQTAKPACAAPVAPEGVLAPWTTPAPLTAGADGPHAAALRGGQAFDVALLPTPQVTYPLQPEKPGTPVSHGGLMGLDVATAGNWRIALSGAAWLDVVGADGAQRSVAHGHGPDCSGIRKMVDFTLKPGHYTIQISASGAAALRVMAVTLP